MYQESQNGASNKLIHLEETSHEKKIHSYQNQKNYLPVVAVVYFYSIAIKFQINAKHVSAIDRNGKNHPENDGKRGYTRIKSGYDKRREPDFN
jgi:hypothetical protein